MKSVDNYLPVARPSRRGDVRSGEDSHIAIALELERERQLVVHVACGPPDVRRRERESQGNHFHVCFVEFRL